MKKVLIGFLLTLSALLLSRYGQLYAQLYAQRFQDCSVDATIENLKRSERVSFENDQSNGAPVVMFASADTQKAKFRIDDATEVKEEDDEFGSSKKYVRGADCISSISSAFSGGNYFRCAVNGASYGSHFSYVTSGRRHIALRVIRI
jgi:hypothetical protein